MRIAAVIAACLVALPAAAADLGRPVAAPVETPRGVAIPACDDPAVLSRIVSRQHWAEANTWRNGVRIEAIRDVRQRHRTTRFISEVEHRLCEAQVDLGPTGGDRLYYMISDGLGFAGVGWYVDFCMPQHDYYRVYDADCRVLK